MITSNRTYKFHPANIIPKGDWVWVFGSDESGKHRNGSAKVAHVSFGAKYGVGKGLTGKAYAIPILDKHFQFLALPQVANDIEEFITVANSSPMKNFYIAQNGFDAAGWALEIANLFAGVPKNCSLPEAWRANVVTKFNA